MEKAKLEALGKSHSRLFPGKSEKVVNFLKRKRIREIIKNINGSEVKFQRLFGQRSVDKEFGEFCNVVLEVMGYLDKDKCFKDVAKKDDLF